MLRSTHSRSFFNSLLGRLWECTYKPLNPLNLCGIVGDSNAARATEQVKDIFVRHPEQVEQATSDQPSSPDAGATVNGDSLALNKLCMEFRKQCRKFTR
jgi:hypothetical protein